MMLGGWISRDALEKLVRDAGGQVTWPQDANSADLWASVDVDPSEAAEQVSFWVPTMRGEFDLRDVRDFACAAASGDRAMALALAPRLFVFDSELATVERALQ